MRRIGGTFLLAVLMGAVAMGTAVRQDATKAKKYVKEVKKHLLESYINKDKMKKSRLEEAGLKGLGKAMDSKEYKGLGRKLRNKITAAVEESESVLEALDAVANVVGDEDFDFLAFADHATREMVKLTKDPFSRILTDTDFAKLQKAMSGGAREDSIGVGVRLKDGRAKVAFVQYGYVGYEEGIEMGDEVLKINGKAASKFTSESLAEAVKVQPGDSIELTIRRKGIDRDLVFKIKQRNVKPKDVHYAMIKGNIGYLRLTIFDMKLVRETKKALQAMKEDGMEALVIDVRNNPGGALPACTGVADLFLKQGIEITRMISHYTPSLGGMKLPGFGGKDQFKTKKKSEFEKLPLVLLINGSSASASEMLAGALQDHKRATLIGETTYGKGVGQSPIFLTSVFMKRYLYLTVMRYTTPKGHEVNHIGVAPDVGYPLKKMNAEEFLGRWDLRESGKIKTYLDNNWSDVKGLAKYDEFKTSNYPGFKAFYRSLSTELTKDQVRSELRRAIRKRIVTKTDKPFVYDLQDDLQLQRGIVELLDKLGDE